MGRGEVTAATRGGAAPGLEGREPGEVVLTVAGRDGSELVAGGRLTAGDWSRRAAAVAAGLAARDAGAGRAVGLCFPPSAWTEFAVAYLAVLEVGATAVLVPAGASRPERDRALRHAGAVGLLGPAGGVGPAGDRIPVVVSGA
ncbi:MAG TPA: AMP-binding protein, partial [Acidimicrobiales bacterium]|nr:AMP-binding protein [Acidimicrobiales bacterium]